MRKVEGNFKQSIAFALKDTLKVVLWSTVPATGVYAYVQRLGTDIPLVAKYGVYIASAINVMAFFVLRFAEYYTGSRKVK